MEKAEKTAERPILAYFYQPQGLLLTVAVLLGGFFRFYELGLSALRADTVTFWTICQKTTGPGQIFREWMQLMGITGQFPFACAATKWFLTVFGLPQTFTTLRLPAAIWGTAAILAAYFAGRELRGPRLGLLAAFITALNPFMIQISREAYFYPPLVLGAYLASWAAFRSLRSWRDGRKPGAGFVVTSMAGFFFLTWSQPTGWILAMLWAAVVLGDLVVRDIRRKRPGMDTIAVVVGLAIVGLPLLLAPWGMKHLIAIASGATKEAALKALQVSERGLGDMMYDFLTIPSWGGTPLRLVVGVVLVTAGLLYLLPELRARWEERLLVVFMGGGLILYLIFRSVTGAQYEVRYLCALIPVYLLWLAGGMDYLAGKVAARIRAARQLNRMFYGLVPALLLGMQLYPAWLCTQLTGKPTPYVDIVRWCDTNLPQGTLVLVDRWFEPWNELRVHSSTNVFFTFTVPNEPLDVFLQQRWRDTAVDFFKRNPGSAYLEIAKEYWHVPEVGPWDWPRRYFARRHAITNEAGLALRRLHLASRGDFYAENTNRVVVEIFYDRPEDIAERWRREGVRCGVLFGPGWDYTKSQDYRDWRVFKGRAALLLLNLGQEPINAYVEIAATAYGGSKEVKLGPQLYHTFVPGRLDVWRAGPIRLLPGNTAAELRDELWPVSHIPLLVSSVRLIPGEAAAGARGPADGAD